MVSLRRASLAVALGVTVVSSACDAVAPVPDFDESPTIGVLLTPDLLTRCCELPSDSGLYAILVTTGTPLRSPYLVAGRFEMRRLSDGARFAWRAIDPPSEAIGVLLPFEAGNYFLPRAGDATGLGSDSIAAGEEYEIVAEAGAHRLVGRTRVPGRVELVRAPTDGDSILRWRRSPGAARYTISGQLFFQEIVPLGDTAYLLRRPLAFPGEGPQRALVRITAIDSNYAAFAGDFRASRAGVAGGWGLVGSYTWTETELPLSGTSAARR
jgi:hypothetical protein